MYEITTQCNSKTCHQMFQLSAAVPNLCLQPKSSLISRFINDRLLDAWPTVIHTSPQLLNTSHRLLIDLLLYYSWDSVIYLLSLECYEVTGWGYNWYWRLATKLHDGCVCMVRWPAVLLKLKLVPRLWLYKEYAIYEWEDIYWSIHVPKISY